MTSIERQVREYTMQAWRQLWQYNGSKVVIDGELDYSDGSTQPITITLELGDIEEGGSYGH